MTPEAEPNTLFADRTLAVSEDRRICAACGTSASELYTTGLMGCVECYTVFSDVVRRALHAIHGEWRHVGKSL